MNVYKRRQKCIICAAMITIISIINCNFKFIIRKNIMDMYVEHNVTKIANNPLNRVSDDVWVRVQSIYSWYDIDP